MDQEVRVETARICHDTRAHLHRADGVEGLIAFFLNGGAPGFRDGRCLPRDKVKVPVSAHNDCICLLKDYIAFDNLNFDLVVNLNHVVMFEHFYLKLLDLYSLKISKNSRVQRDVLALRIFVTIRVLIPCGKREGHASLG